MKLCHRTKSHQEQSTLVCEHIHGCQLLAETVRRFVIEDQELIACERCWKEYASGLPIDLAAKCNACLEEICRDHKLTIESAEASL